MSTTPYIASILCSLLLLSLQVNSEVLVIFRSNADDDHVVYADGVEVGRKTNSVNSTLASAMYTSTGTIVVAVEVTDRGNVGGLIGSFSDINFSVTDNTWKCTRNYTFNWNSPTYDDSSWPYATATRSQGDSYWGTKYDVDRKAEWIWAGDYETTVNTTVTVYCRKKITVPLTISATFSVGLASGLSEGSVVIPFDNADSVIFNEGVFDLSSSSFIAPKTATYFQHASTCTPASTQADVRLSDRTLASLDFGRGHSSYNGSDTTSRNGIGEIISGTPVALQSIYPQCSDSARQVNFAMFSLTDTMGSVPMFEVGKSSSQTTAGTIDFDYVAIDSHSGWSLANNHYVVPVTGSYIIGLGIGAWGSNGSVSTVRLSGFTAVAISMYDTLHNSFDTLSTLFALNALAGDTLDVYLESMRTYSDPRYFTYFFGFQYRPIGDAIAWSIHRVTNATGPADPLQIDSTLINTGNAWDPLRNRVIIPVTGVYYLHLTAGLVGSRQCNLQLLVNDAVRLNVYRSGVNHNNVDTRSNSIIMRLQQGTELHVRLPSNSYIFSDSRRQTTFAGFRLHD